MQIREITFGVGLTIVSGLLPSGWKIVFPHEDVPSLLVYGGIAMGLGLILYGIFSNRNKEVKAQSPVLDVKAGKHFLMDGVNVHGPGGAKLDLDEHAHIRDTNFKSPEKKE